MSATKATRRSTIEVRETILAAAEEAFGEHGYAAATSRELAKKAGVSESVIYRQFGSKSHLFAEAVLAPFLRFLETFSQISARYLSEPLETEAMMRLFVSELVDQLAAHRQTLRTFLAAEEDLDDEVTERFYGAFDEVMKSLGDVVRVEQGIRKREQRALGSEMDVRAAIGMVLSLVVFDDWLLPRGRRRPSREELIDHLSSVLLRRS